MFSLEEAYNQIIKILRNIVEDIRFGRKLYFNPIEIYSTIICKNLNDDTNILSFIKSVQNKNPYMYSHPANVAFISFVIGKWLNLDSYKLVNLFRTALLHDVGKAKIKDSLLNKADALTIEEMEKLKSHPVIGYKIVDSVKLFESEVLQGILFHHERRDGTGYPLGLKGEKINVFSRIIAIADTFDAITASKTYREKNTPLKAIEEIQANSFNQLDQNICKIFIKNIIEYYCGREALLSNEQVGIIVNINPIEFTKPLVRFEDKIHDLSVERDIEIVEIL